MIDPCVDPLPPYLRAKVDMAADAVVRFMNGEPMAAPTCWERRRMRARKPAGRQNETQAKRMAEVARRRAAGESWREMAKSMGLTVSRIYQIKWALEGGR